MEAGKDVRKDKKKGSRNALILKAVSLRGKIKNLKGKLDNKKLSEKEIENIKKEGRKLVEELNITNKKLQKLDSDK